MLRKNPDLIIESVDGELVVLDVSNQKVHKLNDTAALILELCDGIRSLDEIKQVYYARFDVDPKVMEADLEQTLESFLTLGLLELDDADNGQP